MTSVNELNAYNRGKREGYDIGYTAGSTDMIETAKREGTSLRWWKLVIAFVVGFLWAIAFDAHAQATAQTSVTVVISAEVPCTVENAAYSQTCLDDDSEVTQVQNSAQDELSWWQKMVKYIGKFFAS